MQSLFLFGAILGYAQKKPAAIVSLTQLFWATIRCPITKNALLLSSVGTLCAYSMGSTAALAVLAIMATRLPWFGENLDVVKRIYRYVRGIPQ